MLIALHARRSHASIRHFSEAFPGRPLVVVLTGTDLYRDIAHDGEAQRSLDLASRLVVLQELGARMLPDAVRAKVAVIYQSAVAIPRLAPLSRCFEIVVSGHLRAEKDPFRVCAALGKLPGTSRIRVSHAGGALSADYAAQAHEWMKREPRYRWLGEMPHWKAMRLLARSRALVVSSHMEGGANVVCEALACGVPVIASRVDGNVGMLGPDYDGYFTPGNEEELSHLLLRFEQNSDWRSQLQEACAARASLVDPARECRSVQELVAVCLNQPSHGQAAA